MKVIMIPFFVIPVVIWGGVAIVGIGKYLYKNLVFIFLSHKLTPLNLEQLAVVGSGRLECVFCLEPFCENDTVIRLRCTHVFHKTCFMSYVSHSYKICPVCRTLF